MGKDFQETTQRMKQMQKEKILHEIKFLNPFFNSVLFSCCCFPELIREENSKK